MSFDFDNGKNKNHLLKSLIQELEYNIKLITRYKRLRTTILKSFISTGLIFNFDLETQITLSHIYDQIKIYNKNFNSGKAYRILMNIPNLKKDMINIITVLKGIS